MTIRRMLRLRSIRTLFNRVEPLCKAIIIHYHIFKNAGTTVESVLMENFGRGFGRFDPSAPHVMLAESDLCAWLSTHQSLRAISSHNLFPPKPDISGFEFYDLVLLRHPLDRLMSMYKFYQRTNDRSDPVSEAAEKLDAAGFFYFLMEKYPHLINNAQVNYLNGGKKIPREPDLERALRVLRRFSVFGVTDLFDECMVLAEHVLQPSFGTLDFSYLPQNVADGRPSGLTMRLDNMRALCGTQLYERLLKLNKLDLDLAEAASHDAHRRFEQVPNHQQRLLEFKERCDAKRRRLAPAR